MLVACPRCSVHTERSAPTCAHCGAHLRDARGHIARTTVAMLLGLTATGFQPGPPSEYGAPTAPAPASPTVEACRQSDEAATRAPSADTHYDAGVCYHDLASSTPPDGRLALLDRALHHFEQALTLEQRQERLAVIQQRLGQIELALDELEQSTRPPEADAVPVYGVPYPGRASCGCEVAPSPAGAPYAYGALAIALLALRRRRR